MKATTVKVKKGEWINNITQNESENLETDLKGKLIISERGVVIIHSKKGTITTLEESVEFEEEGEYLLA